MTNIKCNYCGCYINVKDSDIKRCDESEEKYFICKVCKNENYI